MIRALTRWATRAALDAYDRLIDLRYPCRFANDTAGPDERTDA